MAEFVVIIPARLASTRLPRKPLADIGGVPMVVRVARNASASGARRVVVAADSEEIVSSCSAHAVECVLTSADHPTGTDRLAEAARRLALAPQEIVVNVQGDEPMMPTAVVQQAASVLATRADCEIATAAHPIADAAEFFDPNVVKVVTDGAGRALYFSRAPIPWSRDAFAADRDTLPEDLPALRHVGLYAYRAAFLLRFPSLARPAIEQHESLEQLRALAHGIGIAVFRLSGALPPGVDTPQDLARVRALIRS
jgi:3-deoxy-manno-octulosonate cytidylyltransferase (CMP-KDO synthetase)